MVSKFIKILKSYAFIHFIKFFSSKCYFFSQLIKISCSLFWNFPYVIPLFPAPCLPKVSKTFAVPNLAPTHTHTHICIGSHPLNYGWRSEVTIMSWSHQPPHSLDRWLGVPDTRSRRLREEEISATVLIRNQILISFIPQLQGCR